MRSDVSIVRDNPTMTTATNQYLDRRSTPVPVDRSKFSNPAPRNQYSNERSIMFFNLEIGSFLLGK